MSEVKYPKYEETFSRLREYVKEGKNLIRYRREKSEADKREMARLEKVEEKEEKMASLVSEHDFFIAKLEHKFISFDWSLMNECSEILTGVSVFENSLDDLYSLHGKIKGLIGKTYDEKFGISFGENLKSLTRKIEGGKFRIKELLSIYEENVRLAEEKRVRIDQEKIDAELDKQAHNQEILTEERKLCAQNL